MAAAGAPEAAAEEARLMLAAARAVLAVSAVLAVGDSCG